jgi:uncharacterized membrane protein (UPF0182 family)
VSTGSLKVTRPQIYFGELAADFVFVKTKQREFDHPAGDANVYTVYNGTGGIEVGNFFRRLALAARFGTSKVLFSQDITNESRILFHRNITERAQLALPTTAPWSGSSMPTLPATAIPTLSAWPTVPITCGTPSRW